MDSSVELPVVGIIGVKGKYGSWLQKHFEERGLRVIGSDLDTELKNKDVVEQANIVIFSVPIISTVDIISELTPYSKETQLWMDITSVKTPAVKAMLESKAEVVGLHPMCAPLVETWKGHNLVVCRARINQWESWLNAWLKKTHAHITESTAEEHDKYTALVQALVHALALTFASTLFKTEADVGKLLQFASPTFKALFALSGRVLSQDSQMYAEIQMSNPVVPKVLETASNTLDHLHKVVIAKHREEFEEIFKNAKEHFGDAKIQEAQHLFERFLKG